ncbi:MAG TPA: nickel pincer cofactor biosynthesis protein LarC, partial [bacterium]|nr:nickel pincer cofactor biosynthesis protein LarC [bacterium]
MKIAYLQCYSGISGDMLLSALLDAGIPEPAFREMLNILGIKDSEVILTKVIKKGISATSIQVVPDADRGHLHVADIRSAIQTCGLSQPVIERAQRAFELIVAAESKVHGVDYDHVHLHEVSGLDTIVDLLGVSWGIEYLGIEKIYASPLNVGSGTVKISHGVVPVPAPATALILQGIPIVDDGLPGERTTPTGAALAVACVDSFSAPGRLVPLVVGYGAGMLDSGDRANVLRLILGKADEVSAHRTVESLMMLETDIDDDTPEIIGYAMDRIRAHPDVLDASVVPTLRKKDRPGFLVRILVRDTGVDAVSDVIFSETSTLGVRRMPVIRTCLPREVVTVKT